MKWIKKASIIIILFIIIFVMLLKLALINIYSKQTNITTAKLTEGQIVVTVLEKGSLKPINNATVCIVETRSYYQTNNKGLTQKISVPILINQNFNSSLTPPNGEITLLVYKSGFADSLTFNVKVPLNSIRVGIIIYLSPIYNIEDNEPILLSELPDPTWAKEIIKLNKK